MFVRQRLVERGAVFLQLLVKIMLARKVVAIGIAGDLVPERVDDRVIHVMPVGRGGDPLDHSLVHIQLEQAAESVLAIGVDHQAGIIQRPDNGERPDRGVFLAIDAVEPARSPENFIDPRLRVIVHPRDHAAVRVGHQVDRVVASGVQPPAAAIAQIGAEHGQFEMPAAGVDPRETARR